MERTVEMSGAKNGLTVLHVHCYMGRSNRRPFQSWIQDVPLKYGTVQIIVKPRGSSIGSQCECAMTLHKAYIVVYSRIVNETDAGNKSIQI